MPQPKAIEMAMVYADGQDIRVQSGGEHGPDRGQARVLSQRGDLMFYRVPPCVHFCMCTRIKRGKQINYHRKLKLEYRLVGSTSRDEHQPQPKRATGENKKQIAARLGIGGFVLPFVMICVLCNACVCIGAV